MTLYTVSTGGIVQAADINQMVNWLNGFAASVKDYGAKGDGKTVTDGAITTGTNILTSATAAFTAADVGKQITVNGAGTSSGNLNTTIAGYTNGTTVTLTANAATSVLSGATFFYATDDTVAIAAARLAAKNAGGGLVWYPNGTYISGNQTLYPYVTDKGAGIGATVIVLKALANTDLFSAQTSLINLSAAGGSSPSGTLHTFSIQDITLDGNKANQTAGPSYPLRFYGYSYILQNLRVKNGYSGNILSDWNAGNAFAPADSMIALWSNIKTHDSNGIGVQIGGPHDSLFTNCEFFQELSHCLHLAPNANGCCLTNVHAWGPGVNTPNTASFLQTVYIQDNFRRTNQSGLGTAADGVAWTQYPVSGTVTAAISSNTATFAGDGTETDGIFLVGSSSATDLDMHIDVNQGGDSSNDIGFYWRGDGTTSNGYRCIFDHGNVVIQKYVSGVRTTISTTASGISTPESTTCTMRLQVVGTSIKAKVWATGTFEPTSWLINTTDSAFASGKFGLWAWTNSAHSTVTNFAAGALRTQSGKVAMLVESTGVNCANCIAESSDTVQVAVLGPNFTWTGGSVYDVLNGGYGFPSVSSGFQMGQQGGDSAYSGQITTPGNQTVYYCRIADVMIGDCQGANGAIWLDNDLGYNVYDVTINQDLVGVDTTGALQVHSVFRRSGLTATNTSVALLDSGVQLNKSSTIYSGSGAPSSSLGANGDFYFRTDTPGTALQRLYVKTATAVWSELLAPTVSATAVAIAASATIATAGIDVSRVAPTGNVASIILASGTVAGQVCQVVNASAFTVTFAASGTSHVADGVSCVIAANHKMDFTWDSGTSLWYHS